ncbi:glycosyltransferase family 4 protein [Candidatus Falkowbacteria bacterium]|nr:glycosyltransferase family 4 protein [Candidatus Falkowbacteria bacterium]
MRKKILFIDHTPFVGGAQLSLIAHVEELDVDLYEPKIICSELADGLGLAKRYADANIPFLQIDMPRLRPYNFKNAKRWWTSAIFLRKVLKEERPDLVVTNTVRSSLTASVAARLEKIPVCWFIRDFTFPRLLFLLFSLLPEKIIFNANATKEYYFAPSKKSEVVHIGRNFHKKLENINKDLILKQRLEWSSPETDLLVGFVGRLVVWKGAQVLIEAISILLQRGFSVKAIIMGTGKNQDDDNEAQILKLADDLSVADNVIFTGHVDDLVVPMAALDVLALTSIEPEPFSSAVVDSMLAGVPVVGTNIGGTPEAIIDNETGFLVCPGDPIELANALEKLVIDKDLLRSFSLRGKDRAMKFFTSAVTTCKIEKIYSSIIR